MRHFTLPLAAIALAAVPILSVGHATEEVSLNSEELLAPYYAKLAAIWLKEL